MRAHCGLAPNSDQLLALYRDADIFVLPTLADASSIASLEAMSAGLPVVATSVGGVPEIVLDGETGLIVPPGDAAALERAIRSLIENPATARKMGEAGRSRYETYFTPEKVAGMIGRLIARVVEQASAGRPIRAAELGIPEPGHPDAEGPAAC